jgi:hypothetical protein
LNFIAGLVLLQSSVTYVASVLVASKKVAAKRDATSIGSLVIAKQVLFVGIEG